MRQDDNIGKLLSHVLNVFDTELLMHFTAPRPTYHLVVEFVWKTHPWLASRKNDLLACFARDVAGEVFIRNKDHFVSIERFNDLDRIRRCATDVRLGFDVSVR